MMMNPLAAVASLAFASLALAGCGFKPIYATSANESGVALSEAISVRQVSAPEAVAGYINDALDHRLPLRPGAAPKYDLYVRASERANRLAVQIDATVTRFNYRLNARYELVDLETGQRMRGNADAVASYNIVTSQYSTLFAERTAQEKAAYLLAEEIERDLLIRLSEGGDIIPDDEATPVTVDDETNLIVEDVGAEDLFSPPQTINDGVERIN